MTAKTTKKRGPKATFLAIPLYLWAVVLVGLPLLYVLGVSFHVRDEVWGVTDALTLANYQKILEPTYLKVFMDSLSMAALTCALVILIGYPFAYAMAKAKPAHRTLLMILVIAPFWTSALIRTYGWMILLKANGPINALFQWLGWIDRPLKLLYTRGAVLLGFVYTLLPFMILPCFTAIDRMEWSAVEAARDLGASPSRAFRTITLPLTLSGVMSGITLTFVPSMGMFFLSDLLGGGKTVLIGNLISQQLLKDRNTPFGAALSVALLGLTALILYLQRKAGGKTQLF